MYTPAHNREPDRQKILEFMRSYPFATLVTTRDGNINATHLPVLIHDEEHGLELVAHLARANAQWRDFDPAQGPAHDALVIFEEPHAFVSTRHYERPLSVPTWNYVAVHAYGLPTICESLQERLTVVEETVQTFEGDLTHWKSLPPEFKDAKANGIVAFRIKVTRLDARFKLSQDRTRLEQENIVRALRESPDSAGAVIADWMAERLER